MKGYRRENISRVSVRMRLLIRWKDGIIYRGLNSEVSSNHFALRLGVLRLRFPAGPWTYVDNVHVLGATISSARLAGINVFCSLLSFFP